MCRVAMLALCAAMLPGCVSVNGGGRPMGSIVGQSELPKPGEWCVARLTDERMGPMSKRQRIIWGRVGSVDEDGLELVDAIEEERVLSGPDSLRGVPILSRSTGFDSEFFLKETRRIARDEILHCKATPESEVVAKRNSLVQVGDKLVQERIGLDFDFNVPAVAQAGHFAVDSRIGQRQDQ